MTNSQYQLYTLLVSLLSAIGTFSAVIVALYLANRERRISLKIDNDIFEFNNAPNNEYIFLQILNDGYQSIYIKNILLEHDIFCKKYIPVRDEYIYLPLTTYNPPVQKLEVGDLITLAIEKQFIIDIYNEILSTYSWYDKFTVKFVVTLSNGKAFKSKLNKTIKSLMGTS